ncbi:CsgG/HfaB family protein [Thermodesulfobacteriota bacterium]
MMRINKAICPAAVLLFFVFSLATQSSAAAADLRYSIMVSKFENRSNWHGRWSLGDAWGAILTDTLNQTKRFIVLGEKDMRGEALKEQDFAASDRTAGGGKKVATGQMTPAQLLVKGDITHFAEKTGGGSSGMSFRGVRVGAGARMAEINAVMYIIDSTTGQVVASKKCYGKIMDQGVNVGVSKFGFSGDVNSFRKTNAGKAIEQAVDMAVTFLIEQLDEIPWSGTVILAKKNKVYINRGEREGVRVGQTFEVGEATTLRDPDTGEVLDQSLEKVGVIEVERVKKKISICNVIEGQGIEKGMTVAVPGEFTSE